ncbi:MAG: cytochrome c [Gemmatimonadaceae bacterium]|jgi:hypothetical protein|nr:cytochrome c [Gemmatimonadaceae bacterium]
MSRGSLMILRRTGRAMLAPVLVLAMAATAPLAAQSTRADSVARGRTIFQSLCRQCHSVTPPAQGAPPMAAIARRYVRVTGSRDSAESRIAAWLSAPDSSRSLLPAPERRRYGVMPHQPLADAGRFAVAAYVVQLGDSMARRAPRP